MEATYRFTGQLAGGANPTADPNDEITVRAGDHIGGAPDDRIKLGADWRATSRLTVGGDLLAVGPQRYVGDENGSLPKLPGWTTLNLHARLKLAPHLELSLQVYNVLDQDYATYGTFFDAAGVQTAGSALQATVDPRTQTPAAPRSGRVGLTYEW